MGVRAEISEKNKWWLPRHRYYELKHFCLQYPAWKKILAKLKGVGVYPLDLEKVSRTNNIDDPTARCVIERSYYLSLPSPVFGSQDSFIDIITFFSSKFNYISITVWLLIAINYYIKL